MKFNETALKSVGAIYPILPEISNIGGNAKLIPMVLDGYPQPAFRRIYPHIDVPGIESAELVQRLVHRNLDKADIVILSVENFQAHHAPALKALLPNEANLQVVFIVRCQDAWLQSYYVQMLKTRLLSGSISEFVNGAWQSDHDSYFWPDWHLEHIAWASCFDRCDTIIYDEVRDELFGHFLRTAGLILTEDFIDLKAQNASLSLFETVLLQN